MGRGLRAHGSGLTRVQLVQARAIATIASPLIGGLCRTLRWRVEGQEHYDAVVESGRQPILVLLSPP
jgi:hypothetical protein